MRVAVASTQLLDKNSDLLDINAQIHAEKPQLNINTFEGLFIKGDENRTQEALSIENTLWSNTVLANGTAIGCIIYTGRETRSVMNTSQPTAKVKITEIIFIKNLFDLKRYSFVLFSLVC